MRYLVTGGAGFIGSHLCDKLLKDGAEVVAVDNLITGTERNLLSALKNSKFQYHKHDITEKFELDGGFAGIFHLASPASPIDYMKYPIETLRVGSIGTENVLKLAQKKNCPVLLASTSEVYGDPLEHPQKETYWGNVNSIGPRSCYDEAKRYAEAITYAYHRAYAVDIRVIRIFNTYGPRMRMNDGRVVPNFCLQALMGEPLTIFGDGKQTRSFCYVDDLVEGIIRVLKSNHHEPINLGNPNEFTMIDFAKAILRLTGSKSEMVFHPLPQDDPKQRQPNISRAKDWLKWSPKITIEEGLPKTIEYFRSLLAS